MDVQIMLAILGCFGLLSKTAEAHMLPKRQAFNGGQDLGESIRLAASGMINRVGSGLNNQFSSLVLPTSPTNQVVIILPGSNSTRIIRELSDDSKNNDTFSSDSNTTTTSLQLSSTATVTVNNSSTVTSPVGNSSVVLEISSPKNISEGDKNNQTSTFNLEIFNSTLIPKILSSTNFSETNISSTTESEPSTTEGNTVTFSTQNHVFSDSLTVSESTTSISTSTDSNRSQETNSIFEKKIELNEGNETVVFNSSSTETTPGSTSVSVSISDRNFQITTDVNMTTSKPTTVAMTEVTVSPNTILTTPINVWELTTTLATPISVRGVLFPLRSGGFVASSAGALTPNSLPLQVGSNTGKSISNSTIAGSSNDQVTTVSVDEGVWNATTSPEETNENSSTISSVELENNSTFPVEEDANGSSIGNGRTTEAPMVIMFNSINDTNSKILNVTDSSLLTSPVLNETANAIGNGTSTTTTAQPTSIAITDQNFTGAAVTFENNTTQISTTAVSATNENSSVSFTSVTSALANNTAETHASSEVSSSTTTPEVTTRYGQESTASVEASISQQTTETSLLALTNQTDNSSFPNSNLTTHNATDLKFFNQLNHLEVLNSTIPSDWSLNVTTVSPVNTTKLVIFNLFTEGLANLTVNSTGQEQLNKSVIFEQPKSSSQQNFNDTFAPYNSTKLKFFNQLNHLEVLNSTIPSDWFINATTESPMNTTKFVVFNLFAADLKNKILNETGEENSTSSTKSNQTSLLLSSTGVPLSSQTFLNLKNDSNNDTEMSAIMTSTPSEITNTTLPEEFNEESFGQGQNVTSHGDLATSLNNTNSSSSDAFDNSLFSFSFSQDNNTVNKTDLNTTETTTSTTASSPSNDTIDTTNTSSTRNETEFSTVRPNDKEQYQIGALEYVNETVPLEYNHLNQEQNGISSLTNSTVRDAAHRSQLLTVALADLMLGNHLSSLNESFLNGSTTMSSLNGPITISSIEGISHSEQIFPENSTNIRVKNQKNGTNITVETATKNQESNRSVATQTATTASFRPASNILLPVSGKGNLTQTTTISLENLTTSPSSSHAEAWALPNFGWGQDDEIPSKMLFLPNIDSTGTTNQLQILSAPTIKTLPRKSLTIARTTRPTESTTTTPSAVYKPEDPEDEKKFWSLIPKPLNAGQVSRLMRTHSNREAQYPSYDQMPQTSFSCSDVSQPGYYADTEAGCQVYHRCDISGGHNKFLCPKTTVFSQLTMVCDYWYNVNCNEQIRHADYVNSRLYRGMNYSHDRFLSRYHARSLLSTSRPSVVTTVTSNETITELPAAKSMIILTTTANSSLRNTTKTPENSTASAASSAASSASMGTTTSVTVSTVTSVGPIAQSQISVGSSSVIGASQANSTSESPIVSGTTSSPTFESSTVISGIEEP